MPTYLKYNYIFFFISISGRIRNIFPADPDPWKKMSDPHPWYVHYMYKWVRLSNSTVWPQLAGPGPDYPV